MTSERIAKWQDGLVWPAVALSQLMLLAVLPTINVMAIYQFNATVEDVGVLFAVSSLVAAFSCPFGGWLSRRVSRRRLILLGSVMYVAWPVLVSLSESLVHLGLCQVFLGLSSGALWPSLEAELARGREGPLLQKRLSVFNVAWSSGMVFGPLLGVLLNPGEDAAGTEAGRQAMNLACLISVAPSVIMVWLLMAWRIRMPAPGEAAAWAAKEPPHDPVRLRTFRKMAYVANFTRCLATSVLSWLFLGLAAEQWAEYDSVSIYFWLLLAQGAACTVTFMAMYVTHGWACRLKRHLAFLLSIVACLVAVSLSSSIAVAAVAFVVVGVAMAFLYSGSLYYSIEGQGEGDHMTGWHEGILAAGGASGLLMASFMPRLLETVGVADAWWRIRSPYLLAAALFAVGILAQLGIYLRRPRCRTAA